MKFLLKPYYSPFWCFIYSWLQRQMDFSLFWKSWILYDGIL